MKSTVFVLILVMALYVITVNSEHTCLFPALCSHPGIPLVSATPCFLGCFVACEPNPLINVFTSTCKTFEGDRVLEPSDLNSKPTVAYCHCHHSCVPTWHSRSINIPTLALALEPAVYCASCGATGFSKAYFNPMEKRFEIVCTYGGESSCNKIEEAEKAAQLEKAKIAEEASHKESGLPVSGLPVSGLPVSGLPVSGLPASGLPVSGLPVSGLPASGLPVSGLPVSGLPVSGLPISGHPISGLPVSGLPISGLPVSGLPVSGLPVSGLLGSLHGVGPHLM